MLPQGWAAWFDDNENAYYLKPDGSTTWDLPTFSGPTPMDGQSTLSSNIEAVIKANLLDKGPAVLR